VLKKMAKVIELEEKYYCENPDSLISMISSLGFKLSNNIHEVDEYFTDINSVYIEDRTCLRIRKVDNKNMELTFKGKSKEFTNFFAKTENNMILSIDDYNNIVELLSSLGYYSYTIVDKQRKIYTKLQDGLTYNILVDEIIDLGGFVEFELVSSDIDADMSLLEKDLKKFVKQFSKLDLETADLPYRDFVAEKIYNMILPQEKFNALLFDLDGTLINSEIVFFESFRDVLKNKYSVKINLKDYEDNELKKNANFIKKLKKEKKISIEVSDDEIMSLVYSDYEKKFKEKIIADKEVRLNFELLRQIKEKKIKVGLVTTCRRKFINILLKEIDNDDLFDVIIAREDVDNLKPAPDAYLKALNKLKLNSHSCIAIEDSKRGIDASVSAGIKTLYVTSYSMHKEKIKNAIEFDKASRIMLIIINNII